MESCPSKIATVSIFSFVFVFVFVFPFVFLLFVFAYSIFSILTCICVTASKRDGGVLSEQDIATWVEELVPVINVEQNDGNVDNVYIAINVDQNDCTWQCLPMLTMLTMSSMLTRMMARASACQG